MSDSNNTCYWIRHSESCTNLSKGPQVDLLTDGILYGFEHMLDMHCFNKQVDENIKSSLKKYLQHRDINTIINNYSQHNKFLALLDKKEHLLNLPFKGKEQSTNLSKFTNRMLIRNIIEANEILDQLKEKKVKLNKDNLDTILHVYSFIELFKLPRTLDKIFKNTTKILNNTEKTILDNKINKINTLIDWINEHLCEQLKTEITYIENIENKNLQDIQTQTNIIDNIKNIEKTIRDELRKKPNLDIKPIIDLADEIHNNLFSTDKNIYTIADIIEDVRNCKVMPNKSNILEGKETTNLNCADQDAFVIEPCLSFVGIQQASIMGLEQINNIIQENTIFIASPLTRTIMTAILSIRYLGYFKYINKFDKLDLNTIKLFVVPYINEVHHLECVDKHNIAVPLKELIKKIETVKKWIKEHIELTIIGDLLLICKNISKLLTKEGNSAEQQIKQFIEPITKDLNRITCAELLFNLKQLIETIQDIKQDIIDRINFYSTVIQYENEKNIQTKDTLIEFFINGPAIDYSIYSDEYNKDLEILSSPKTSILNVQISNYNKFLDIKENKFKNNQIIAFSHAAFILELWKHKDSLSYYEEIFNNTPQSLESILMNTTIFKEDNNFSIYYNPKRLRTLIPNIEKIKYNNSFDIINTCSNTSLLAQTNNFIEYPHIETNDNTGNTVSDIYKEYESLLTQIKYSNDISELIKDSYDINTADLLILKILHNIQSFESFNTLKQLNYEQKSINNLINFFTDTNIKQIDELRNNLIELNKLTIDDNLINILLEYIYNYIKLYIQQGGSLNTDNYYKKYLKYKQKYILLKTK